MLVGRLGDSAIGGEYEGPLVALADALDGVDGVTARLGPVPGVRTAEHDGGVFLGRQAFRLPRRDLLPPLDRYAKVDLGTHQKLAGYVEASRGCAHRCLHCPITPVYGGRLRIVERDVVLEDVAQLVRMGAEHVTFGDPDFFNGIRHSLRIVEELHAAFPDLTYDVTIKVEHLLEHREHLATLARTGCLFIVSAVEAVHDHVLAHLAKGHTAADVDLALRPHRARPGCRSARPSCRSRPGSASTSTWSYWRSSDRDGWSGTSIRSSSRFGCWCRGGRACTGRRRSRRTSAGSTPRRSRTPGGTPIRGWTPSSGTWRRRSRRLRRPGSRQRRHWRRWSGWRWRRPGGRRERAAGHTMRAGAPDWPRSCRA